MSQPMFTRRVVKLADEVAIDLRQHIRAAGLKEGDRLPTEQELCARYGVSRTVVREAVAQLKTEALVNARQGSGVFVARAGSSLFRIARNADDLGHLRNLYELRKGTEIAAAGFAARRRTDVDLIRLEAAIAAMQTPETRALGDIDFHVAVATATRNELYEGFVTFLGNALAAAIEAAVRNTIERHPADQAKVIAEHRVVVDAIARRNAEAAKQAMGEHIKFAMQRMALSDACLTAAAS